MRTVALAVAAFFAVVRPCAAAPADVDRGKTLGNLSAPMVMELYCDLSNPQCKRFHDETLPFIVRDYVDTGKAYLIFREFPQPGRPYAKLASTYATAAARVGKYRAVLDALFRNQLTWTTNGQVLETVVTVLTPAEQEQVEASAVDAGVAAEVQRDVNDGITEMVSAVPTIVVTAKQKRSRLSPFPYLTFKNAVDGLAK